MGGNALKHTQTRRYALQEYTELYNALSVRLNSMLGPHKQALIPAYREKTSFGDMDIVYDGPRLSVDDVEREFSPNEIVKNGDVISFNYDQLQIDLINTKTFDYSLCYFSYNDLGNLIGKLARRAGLKHGHNGLFLPLRLAEHYQVDIPVTTDYSAALEFLDLSPERFRQGFDTLQDIFDYVAGSRYFNPDAYKLENLNNIARVRDRKRSTYREFLKYCETAKPGSHAAKVDTVLYLPQIFDAFPDVRPRFMAEVAEMQVYCAAKDKFNGDVVTKLTGLTGKRLGEFIQYTKKHDILGNNHLIAVLNSATIDALVKDLYERFSLSN